MTAKQGANISPTYRNQKAQFVLETKLSCGQWLCSNVGVPDPQGWERLKPDFSVFPSSSGHPGRKRTSDPVPSNTEKTASTGEKTTEKEYKEIFTHGDSLLFNILRVLACMILKKTKEKNPKSVITFITDME